MFNLSDTHGSAEVTFVHKYEQLLQKLHTVSFNRHLDLKDSHEVATKYDKHPTLSTIGSSIQTSDETVFTIVDQFLSTTTLPTFTEETLQAVRKSKSPLLQYIEPEQIPLMTLFDLLCSSATGRKESVKLLGKVGIYTNHHPCNLFSLHLYRNYSDIHGSTINEAIIYL